MLFRFRFLFLLIFITFLYTSFYAQFHVDPHHDGIILKPAIDVLNGKRLFSDTFTQYGALTTIIQVGFLKVFGPTLLVQRMSAVVMYVLIVTFLYFLNRKLFSPLISAGVGLLWLSTAYFPNQAIIVPFLAWSSVYALVFQLAAAVFYLRYIEKNHTRDICIAGACCALSFWSRQPVGIFLTLALLSVSIIRTLILPEKKRGIYQIGAFLFGAVAVSIPFFIWLFLAGSTHDWWQQSIILAFNFGDRLSGSFSIDSILVKLFPSVFESKKNLLWLTAIFSSLVLAASQAIVILVQKKDTAARTWLLFAFSIISLASWMQFFPANDQSHFFWAGAPMIGVALYTVYKSICFLYTYSMRELQMKATNVSMVSAAMTVVLLIPMFLSFWATDVSGIIYYTRSPFVTLTSPPVLRGMKVVADEHQVMSSVENKLQEYFAKYPEKTYINVTPDGLYGLFDPHMYAFHTQHVYWDWASETVFTDYMEKLTAYVDAKRPLILVRDPLLFDGYCSVDLAIHHPIRIHMFQRPLVVRAPIEDVLNVQKKPAGWQIDSKFGSIQTKGENTNWKITQVDTDTINVQLMQTATSSSSLTIVSDFAGECTQEL